MNVRDLYRVHRENYEERKQRRIEEGLPEKPAKSVEPKDQSKIADKLKAKAEEELQTLLPPEYENAEQFMDKKKSKDRVQDEDYEEEVMKVKKLLDPMQMRPLEEDLKSPKVDENRIVKPSVGLTSTALHEFIPATELKGLDDYILESDQYQYYKDGSDFEIKVEKETTLNFPEHLKIFTFEEGNNSRFPTPRRGPNGNFGNDKIICYFIYCLII